MKDYVEYLSEVLGLRQVMMPSPVASQTAVTEVDGEILTKPAFFYARSGAQVEGRDFTRCSLGIINWVREPHESLFQPEVADLFGKMFSAMKIPVEKTLIVDCVMNERNLIANEFFKICEPDVVLFFSNDPTQLSEMQIKGPAKWIETLSPAVLTQQPASKKLVWNDMQKVMRELA